MKLDKTTARFILGAGMMLFSFTWFTLLLFIDVPEANREIISTASGFFLGTGLALILQYHFGSSQGSSDKTEMMAKNGQGTP